MEIKVKLSNLRTAPRKVRQVIDLVRGKKVLEAQSILLFTVNKSARSVLKLLNSAVDSAKTNYKLNEDDLFISKITVDEGPKLKRWHPMSRGRAYPILKRSAHIALSISEVNTVSQKQAKKEGKATKTPVSANGGAEIKEKSVVKKEVKKSVKSKAKKTIKK
jgi:large subunit ribosomal protein L22